MSDNIVIKVEEVNKAFKLPHEKQTSVKDLFLNIFKGRRTYEYQQVLKGISFEIKKGEFFGIVGRNGSGKSTLLKLLAGIYSPDTGRIQVKGKLTPFIELGVGFNPELTGRENVFLNGALLGFNRKEIEEMYDEIVEFAELEKHMGVQLKNFSSGMQVRLAFSIAIRAKSDILLLDEVLAVGDVNFQKKCYEYLRSIKETDKTVVFISHDTSAVSEYCDKAILIDNAEMIDVGSNDVDDVLDAYLDIMDPNRKKTSKSIANKKNINGINFEVANQKVNEDSIEIDFQFKDLKRRNELFAAVAVKDHIGSLLYAYNSARIKHPKPLVKNDTYKLRFKMLNVLNNGKYFVNLAVMDRSGHPIARYEDILTFEVKNKDINVTPINPQIEILEK